MTLSLLKKHPTIRLNSRPWTARRWTQAGLCLLLTCCIAQSSSEVRAQSTEAPAEISNSEEPETDPIERLRKRSALERWKKLSQGWKQRTKSVKDKIQKVPQEDLPPVRRRLPLNLSASESPDTLGPRLNAVESANSSPVPAMMASEATQTETKSENLEIVPVPDDQQEPSKKWRATEKISTGKRGLAKNKTADPLFRTASLNKQPLQVQGALKDETPTEIKKITEISPFADYEPDLETLGEDPCRNQCPRPDGLCDTKGEKGRTAICPELTPLSEEEYQPRQLPSSLYAWEAPNLYHNPLYFEDPQLERYGHTYNEAVQPFVSVGKFGVQLVGLPYQMAIDPVCKRKYTLGWYRPGECAPKKHYQVPFNWDAAATQAAATTGMIFLIP